MIGQTLSHYKVIGEISRGGMGVVYRALDLKLNREVALKVLRPELVADRERKQRFVQEAQAAAALKHPNIAMIHEVDEVDGVDFIAMELVEGERLSDLLHRGPLPLDRLLAIARDVTDALQAAHEHGIVHRDLKPSNIMLDLDGRGKLIDFGLAKLLEIPASDSSDRETAVRAETQTGHILGTVYYMSPEQARGEPVDARSDQFSLGATLYEMATGTRAFDGNTPASIFDSILNHIPPPPSQHNPEVPAALSRIVSRLLEKDPSRRFGSASELGRELRELANPMKRTNRTAWATAAAIAAVVVGALAFWFFEREADVRWAREQAFPEILRLTEEEDFSAAFELAQRSARFIPDDPLLQGLWPRISRAVAVETDPSGAEVYYRTQGEDSPWIHAGRTPVTLALPRTFLHWKLEKEGFETIEAAAFPSWVGEDATLSRELDPIARETSSMTRVSAGREPVFLPGLEHLEVDLDSFLIDRFEVTNRQFKDFIDAGGYQKSDYWSVDNGELVDATGRAGPATWELGDYPDGKEDYPVQGVSWHEAQAYCTHAGKQLPTVYHWQRAAATTLAHHIVPWSNFGGAGPLPVGQSTGISTFGVYDMAGNVKEWCWNDSDGKRFILGGAWSEPTYMFVDPDAQDPSLRRDTYGFRCMQTTSDDSAASATMAPIALPERDFASIEPISDDVFSIYRRLFSYDRTPLNAEVVSVDESPEEWRTEVVTIDAAYRGERFDIYIHIPKSPTPPYQTVMYFPGSGVIDRPNLEPQLGGSRPSGSERGGLGGIEFLLKSGRVVVLPVYKGTFGRSSEVRNDVPEESNKYRDHMVMWVQDLARALDYLESRDDFGEEFALYGFSWGASMGALLPALEDRLKVSVLVAGGYYMQATLPEVDYPTYAPRVTIPTLMLNGRHDFFYPVETSQNPMFEMLGTPAHQKRHVLFDTGHAVPRVEGITEVLNWLDQYLGPVAE
jgi:tRNA A-37 threonylcarbamoyl transferase component Bud32/pimeloyl-ACP methyl ester carboxylesterase